MLPAPRAAGVQVPRVREAEQGRQAAPRGKPGSCKRCWAHAASVLVAAVAVGAWVSASWRRHDQPGPAVTTAAECCMGHTAHSNQQLLVPWSSSKLTTSSRGQLRQPVPCHHHPHLRTCSACHAAPLMLLRLLILLPQVAQGHHLCHLCSGEPIQGELERAEGHNWAGC